MVSLGACDVPLVIETGQVIETHHVAMLIAAGAGAVCPYLALDLSESAGAEGATRYREAVEVGLRKVLARMGICTIGSYRNSQLFEIVGLNQDVRDEFFEDAGGALGGKSLEELLQDSLERHTSAFASRTTNLTGAAARRRALSLSPNWRASLQLSRPRPPNAPIREITHTGELPSLC